MIVIPHLRQVRSTSVSGPITSLSLIITWARAANIGDSAKACGECGLHFRQRIYCSVARANVLGGQPAVGREVHVVHHSGLEEVDDVFVLAILWTVAGKIEGGEAGGVFGELVAPEVRIWLALRNPESVDWMLARGVICLEAELNNLFMYASKSSLPNGSRNVPIFGPLYGATTVPFGRPFVVLGDGTGSYWRLWALVNRDFERDHEVGLT